LEILVAAERVGVVQPAEQEVALMVLRVVVLEQACEAGSGVWEAEVPGWV
jgi:hypothetical protein